MAFVTTWTTTGVDETITIPCGNIGTYNATIDWGDGSPDSVITSFNDADLAHIYAVANTYTVTITGTLPWVFFNNGGDKLKIKSIEEWGDVGVLSGEDSYYGCENLVGNATDTPDMSAVTNMEQMFRGAKLFNGDIGGWDVSSVENMLAMLFGAEAFNQDIGGWDVSSVQNARFMFFGATLFNQDIGGWDVSSITNMEQMFRNATAFNQDIGGWDLSSVLVTAHMFYGATAFNQDISAWDVSAVTKFRYMFYGATAFNQDIGGWDIVSPGEMDNMFNGATAFDQSLCGWDITAATNLSNMLFGTTLSTANYDKLLIAWAALDVVDGLNFHGGNAEYCFGADAHASLIADQTWTITDGGLGAGPCVNPGPCVPVPVETGTRTGGRHGPPSRSRSRYRYPRRIMVGGKYFVAQSSAEELAILSAYIREQQEKLELAPAPAVVKRRIRVAMTRIMAINVVRREEKRSKQNTELLMILGAM